MSGTGGASNRCSSCAFSVRCCASFVRSCSFSVRSCASFSRQYFRPGKSLGSMRLSSASASSILFNVIFDLQDLRFQSAHFVERRHLLAITCSALTARSPRSRAGEFVWAVMMDVCLDVAG